MGKNGALGTTVCRNRVSSARGAMHGRGKKKSEESWTDRGSTRYVVVLTAIHDLATRARRGASGLSNIQWHSHRVIFILILVVRAVAPGLCDFRQPRRDKRETDRRKQRRLGAGVSVTQLECSRTSAILKASHSMHFRFLWRYTHGASW